MALEPRASVVPFGEATDATRAAFLAGLKRQRGLDGNPAAWHCDGCDATIPGDQIPISYDVGDTPIPYCPKCPAYGPDLKPAAV
jgi:NAD-dependent SIR2 family protein deacetylase